MSQQPINTDTIQITPEILSLVAEIDEFKGAWRALGTLAPERLSALRRVATIESIGSSTRIEGSKLSDRDVEKLLANLEIKDDVQSENKLAVGDDEIRLDALLAQSEANLKASISDEVRESLRPEFNLMGSIATNAQKNDFKSSLSSFTDRSTNTTMVGVELRMDLDFWGKSKVSRAAELESQASELKKNFSKHESDQSKSELIRRHTEINRSIENAKALVQIQVEKARRERDRLERGRTVTFQVINFEQEQSESESLLIKLLTERRKLEANRQLFVSENFGE
jgi:outer membrane protein TolC